MAAPLRAPAASLGLSCLPCLPQQRCSPPSANPPAPLRSYLREQVVAAEDATPDELRALLKRAKAAVEAYHRMLEENVRIIADYAKKV